MLIAACRRCRAVDGAGAATSARVSLRARPLGAGRDRAAAPGRARPLALAVRAVDDRTSAVVPPGRRGPAARAAGRVQGVPAAAAATSSRCATSRCASTTRRRIVALVGESGSGKTTAGRSASGPDPPTERRGPYRGRPLARLDAAGGTPVPPATSRRSLRTRTRRSTPSTASATSSARAAALQPYATGAEASAPAPRSLEFVGLRRPRRPGAVPAPAQRRRAPAADDRSRALLPRVIVADEPVSMVDASLRLILRSSTRPQRARDLAAVHLARPLDRLPDRR